MKVMLHYEDNDNADYHKTLKITLPKSWKTGPTSQLLEQFVEAYNPKFEANQLDVTQCHLSIRREIVGNTNGDTELYALPSNAVVIDEIPDRGDVYICHGVSQTIEDIEAIQKAKIAEEQSKTQNLVSCTRFGCSKRFPKGGPYTSDGGCRYHKLPPVFHETAKYWACCPNKKAYDWDDFQSIPGCETCDTCTEVKENNDQKLFLGGTDLREQMNDGPKLKSIDDFNKTMASGGAEAAPVLERLQKVLEELGIEKELYEQVIGGMKKDFANEASNDAELLQLIATELGNKLKSSFKNIAAEQLRIK